MIIEDGVLKEVKNEDLSEDYAFIVPDTVTRINGQAFESCNLLKKITISKYTTDVPGWSFYQCPDLETILVNSGNSVYHGASNCLIETATKTLIVGSKNSIIPTDGSVTMIGEYSFEGRKISSITIPATIITIKSGAFADCQNLGSIVFDTNSSLEEIESFAFFKCSNLEEINIPQNVESIGSSAFGTCYHLSTITLPFIGATRDGQSNTYFGYIFGATSYESQSAYIPFDLTSVNVLGGYSVADYAFYKCSSLISITLPNNITAIRDHAFHNCTNLTSITIPNTVTTIGDKAFFNCYSLNKPGKFKGTNNLMKCRNQTYVLNTWYEEESVALCDRGFHFCENAFDLFNYYHGKLGNTATDDVRFFNVETIDVVNDKKKDSKRVCRKIRLISEITSYSQLLNQS